MRGGGIPSGPHSLSLVPLSHPSIHLFPPQTVRITDLLTPNNATLATVNHDTKIDWLVRLAGLPRGGGRRQGGGLRGVRESQGEGRMRSRRSRLEDSRDVCGGTAPSHVAPLLPHSFRSSIIEAHICCSATRSGT